jgi:hypothetical protein
MNQTRSLCLVIRFASGNDNHHIWNNNGIWWCHFTLREGHGRTRRIRKSLKTRDQEKAREKRDRILDSLRNASGRLVA